MPFKIGMELKKNHDGRTVTISGVGSQHIKVDGDFEPNHIIMKDKVLSYYSIVNDKLKKPNMDLVDYLIHLKGEYNLSDKDIHLILDRAKGNF